MQNNINKKNGDGIEINTNTCVLCGMCKSSCPVKAIEIDKSNRLWIINRDLCILCGMCIDVCPKESLSFENPYSSNDESSSKDAFNVKETMSVRNYRNRKREHNK